MATRSVIGKLVESGEVIYQYCHYDGHIDGVGEQLYKNYHNVHSIDKNLLTEKEIREVLENRIDYFPEYRPPKRIILSEYVSGNYYIGIDYFYYYDVANDEWFVNACDNKNFVLLSQVLSDKSICIQQ